MPETPKNIILHSVVERYADEPEDGYQFTKETLSAMHGLQVPVFESPQDIMTFDEERSPVGEASMIWHPEKEELHTEIELNMTNEKSVQLKTLFDDGKIKPDLTIIASEIEDGEKHKIIKRAELLNLTFSPNFREPPRPQ